VLLIGGVVAIAAFMSPEAALPLLAVALPFTLGLLGLLVLAAMVAPVPPAIFIGGRLRPSSSVYARFLLGFLVIVVVAARALCRTLLPVRGGGGWDRSLADQGGTAEAEKELRASSDELLTAGFWLPERSSGAGPANVTQKTRSGWEPAAGRWQLELGGPHGREYGSLGPKPLYRAVGVPDRLGGC
jgi:hypothetical protein